MSALVWGSAEGVEWIEATLPGGRAAFSARRGGVSTGPYASLNLGILTDDDPGLVAENRRRLALALGRDPGGVAMGLQVHGAAVQVHDTPPPEGQRAYSHPGPALERADVQVTGSGSVTPLVLVADCFPLALSAPGAVAMAHCGWRGVADGVVASAVEAIGGVSGTAPAEVHAALGPGIGACCYEVGAEVTNAFTGRGHAAALSADGHLDLAAVIRAELGRAGVDEGRVSGCGLCTACNPELFFSHRRDDGVTGRQAGAAWLA
jgi:hypothetical protein